MERVNGGTRLKEDWKELGVKSTRGWCNKVNDNGWLAVDSREADRVLCRVARLPTCPAMSPIYCHTSWVDKRAPALGAAPPKPGLLVLWVALIFVSINVDFLTLKQEITAVLFLVNYLNSW